ncbi:MAG: M13-type metalloendopeptidase [Luteimonas sp.]
MPINPSSVFARPLALAATAVLLAGLAADASAQRSGASEAPAACTDFYTFANHDWLQANALPGPGIASTSALQELRDLAQRQQRQLLDSAMNAPENEIQQLLGNFWASGLDEAAVEADGAQPIATLLSRIDGIRRARDIAPTIAALHQVGIPVAFGFNADVDLDDLDRHIGYFSQGGLGLPGPDFYSREDADTQSLLERYRDYVRNILALTGVAEDELEAQTGAVIDLETQIAAYWHELEHMRDPRNNYAPVPTNGLRRQYRQLRLDQFLEAQEVDSETVSLANPELFALLDHLVANAPAAQWQSYLRFHVGNAMAPYLSQAFRDAEFEFHGRVLRGETAPAARPDQVLAAINKAAGPMLAREYVSAHLPDATRARAELIAGQVRDALLGALERNEWMDEATRAEATRKLQALRIEVGAPVQDLDFSLQPMGRDSFGANMLIASTWRHAQEMRRIGQANATRRWDVLPQQPALAYDVAHNRLIVSAAVLQPPVLDVAADPVAHYGSFGALVGHELGRSVDILGRYVDAGGSLRDWWTEADEIAWNERAHGLATQYHAYAFPGTDDAMVDGTRNRDANAADLAGLELALDALEGANPEPSEEASQAFFQAWASLWRQQLSPDAAAVAAASQVRTPGKWRANGPLANMPAFGAAFDCKPDAQMQRPEEDQVRIWR